MESASLDIPVSVTADNDLICAGLTELITQSPGLVCTTCCDHENAARTSQVLVALLPTESLRKLTTTDRLNLPIVGIASNYPVPTLEALQLLTGGVRALLYPSQPAQDIVMAVRMILNHNTIVPDDIVNDLFRTTSTTRFLRTSTDAWAGLSDVDTRILALMADGATNHEIASALHLTPSMVKHHVHNILKILGVSRRVQTAPVYIRHQKRLQERTLASGDAWAVSPDP